MKLNKYYTAAFAMIVGTALHAVPVIDEPFADSDPSLTGNATGTGLTGNWSGDNRVDVVSSNLFFGSLATSDNAAFADGSWFANKASIDMTNTDYTDLLANGGEMWFSMVYRKDTGNGRFYFSISDGGMSNNGNLATGATGIGFGSTGSNLYAGLWETNDWGTTNLGGPAHTSVDVNGDETVDSGDSGSLAGATTYLIVGRVQWGADGAADDTVTLYLPGTDLTQGAIVAQSVGVVDQSGFEFINTNHGNGLTSRWDEIRVGATYADVTPLDVTDPLLLAVSPVGAGDPPGGDDSLFRATFDEPVEALASPTGSIVFRNAGDDTVYTTIAVTDGTQVTFDGLNVDIAPTLLPIPGNSYYIEIEPGALQDAATNSFAGFIGAAIWSFTVDNTPPVVTITNNSVNGEVFFSVQPSVTYTLTFDEVITTTAGTSDFEVLGTAAATVDSVAQTTDNVLEVVTTATGFGTMTLNVKASASFSDLLGNTLTGPFADTETITVRDISELTNQLGILDLSTNNGTNPQTGNLWQAGDKYRFVFTSSGTTDATSTDIADYNTFVQNLANASSLNIGAAHGATWKVLASTAAVDARDNTETNIAVNGTGEPIYLLNGTSLVAADYEALYTANAHASGINKTEELGSPPNNLPGGSQYGDTWTGTRGDQYPNVNYGTVYSGRELGTAGTTTQGGLWGATSGMHWVVRWDRAKTGLLPVYALSMPLTVQTTGGGSPFDTWANGGETFEGDANGDGVQDGMAFLLGAATPSTDANSLLPVVTENGSGGLVMTFSMLDAATRGAAALSTEHSGDLGITDAWTADLVPDSSGVVGDVTFVVSGAGTLNVVATIPAAGNAIDGKLFGRVRGTE